MLLWIKVIIISTIVYFALDGIKADFGFKAAFVTASSILVVALFLHLAKLD